MSVRSSSTPSVSADSRTTLARLLTERLRRAGLRCAYGFPGGGSNLDLVGAFEDAEIDWVLTHSEGGAAFMHVERARPDVVSDLADSGPLRQASAG